MLSLLTAGVPTFLTTVGTLIIAITLHEAAHAAAAKLLGDSTADREGRLTLNPFRHLDPWGTVALFIAGFGWGRPVPIDPRNFKRPLRDELLVALAGPAANLATALVAIVILKHAGDFALAGFVASLARLSLVLAVFNLLPIGPLDGSRLAEVTFAKIGKSRWTAPFLLWSGRLLLAAILIEVVTRIPLLWAVLAPIVDGLAALIWIVS